MEVVTAAMATRQPDVSSGYKAFGRMLRTSALGFEDGMVVQTEMVKIAMSLWHLLKLDQRSLRLKYDHRNLDASAILVTLIRSHVISKRTNHFLRRFMDV